MTRIVQISDLHFDRDRPELAEPLLRAIAAARPDLVVVSGDFVQRARTAQFRKARAFLDRLPAPWLAVPGNHDIPLWNVVARLVRPHAAYRRWIAQDCEPIHEDGGTVALGIDTTDPLAHPRGWITTHQIERVCATLAREDGRRTLIVAAHHPFHHRPEVEKTLMQSAPEALERWAACGPHLILSGHLHNWLAEPFLAHRGGTRTLLIHAGTGLSTRQRGEPNDFAVLDCHGTGVSATRMQAGDATLAFVKAGTHRFCRDDSGWSEVSREDPVARIERRH